jgi:hypothetical protein
MHDRQQLLDEKEGRSDIDSEQPIEVVDGGFLDCRGFGNAGIGHEDVEPIANNASYLLGEFVRTI